MPGDPLYKRADWATAKAYWAKAPECQAPRCICPAGRAITPGHRLWGLDVGHIVSKYEARRMGWHDAQINALSNTRPEHRRCNRHAGAKVGGHVRSRAPKPRPITSREW